MENLINALERTIARCDEVLEKLKDQKCCGGTPHGYDLGRAPPMGQIVETELAIRTADPAKPLVSDEQAPTLDELLTAEPDAPTDDSDPVVVQIAAPVTDEMKESVLRYLKSIKVESVHRGSIEFAIGESDCQELLDAMVLDGTIVAKRSNSKLRYSLASKRPETAKIAKRGRGRPRIERAEDDTKVRSEPVTKSLMTQTWQCLLSRGVPTAEPELRDALGIKGRLTDVLNALKKDGTVESVGQRRGTKWVAK